MARRDDRTPLTAARAADWRPGRPLTRRALLGGVARGALVTLALPPLEAMFDAGGTAYAADGGLPTRFGLWMWGNGMHPDRFVPTTTGVGDQWTLPLESAPLAPIKHKLAMVSGLACKIPNVVPHGSGLVAMLTGADYVEVSGHKAFAKPTIDQVIANEIGASSVYKSVQTAASDVPGSSFTGPDSRNPAEADPYQFFSRMFGDTFVEPGKDGLADPRLGLQRSVLDAVMGDLAALQARVSATDRARLDRHLTGVREIEQRLAILQLNPPNLEACRRADAPVGSYADVAGRAQVSARNRIMSDMLALTLACDQTRVFAHFFTGPVSDVLFPGAPAGHHDLTHNEGGTQPAVEAITVQCMEELAYTLQALDAIDEGDGTLLDHMVVLATSEVSFAQTHSILDMPAVLAGSANGFFKQDVHHRSISGEPVTALLVSLQRAMGMPVGAFGEGEMAVSDGISGVEA